MNRVEQCRVLGQTRDGSGSPPVTCVISTVVVANVAGVTVPQCSTDSRRTRSVKLVLLQTAMVRCGPAQPRVFAFHHSCSKRLEGLTRIAPWLKETGEAHCGSALYTPVFPEQCH